MDFKEYDGKINAELAELEKMEWEVYYRTLLPDFMQQFEDDYIGKPEDKEKAIKEHRAALIARHVPRVQRSLDRKREKLTIKYLKELNERLESAQNEADQDEDGKWNTADYKELECEPEASCDCEDNQPLTSEIITDQQKEIEQLKTELQDKQESLDICTGLTDSKRKDLFIRFENYTEKLQYMVNSIIDRYGFNRGSSADKEEAIIFACSKGNIGTELEIVGDYVLKINEIRKELEASEVQEI